LAGFLFCSPAGVSTLFSIKVIYTLVYTLVYRLIYN
jgi:hypothetical protein